MPKEWKPDEQFLEFLLKEYKKEHELNEDTTLIEVYEGRKPFTVRDLFEDMKNGANKDSRDDYNKFYNNPHYQQKFEAWKAEKNN